MVGGRRAEEEVAVGLDAHAELRDPFRPLCAVLRQFLHLRLRLLQADPHVHLAEHGRRRGEVFLSVLPPTRPAMELAKAEAAARHKGAHAELLGERHRLLVRPLRIAKVAGSAAPCDVSEQGERVGLVSPLALRAEEIERPCRGLPGFAQTAGQQVDLARPQHDAR